VAERTPASYVTINTDDALALSVKEGEMLSFDVDGQHYRLPVKVSNTLPNGIGGLPYGLPGLPFVELPAWGKLKKE
jgi:NADH-quinone oxidoreductase subunit G